MNAKDRTARVARDTIALTAMITFLKGLGMRTASPGILRDYELETSVGLLGISVYPNSFYEGVAVMTYFVDRDRSEGMRDRLGIPGNCKWNHENFDIPVEDAIEDINHKFAPLLVGMPRPSIG